jgi:hypothetical protein
MVLIFSVFVNLFKKPFCKQKLKLISQAMYVYRSIKACCSTFVIVEKQRVLLILSVLLHMYHICMFLVLMIVITCA